MIIRLSLILSAWLLYAGSVAARSVEPDTVQMAMAEAIQRALDVSPEVGAARAQQDYAEARSRFAAAKRYLTSVRLTTLHTFAPGLSIPDPSVPLDQLYLDPDVRNDWSALRPFNRFEVEVRQPLYTWGELGGNIRAARHGVGVEQAGVREVESEVALRTAELYQGLLLATSLRRLTADAEDVLATARRELERMLEEGAAEVDDADLFKLQITEQEFLSRVAEVDQQFETARTALRRQLMMGDGMVVSPSQTTLTPVALQADSLDTYLALAAQHRPEIAMAHAGIRAREALVEVARSDYYPKLFLAGTGVLGVAHGRHRQPNPFVGDSFRDRTLGAALGIRMNLNLNQTRAQVQQARAQLNEVRHQEVAAVQLVAFEVEEAFRRTSTADARMAARERALAIAREWLRTEQINFDLGLGNPQNLIDAVQATMELEASHLESVYNYNRAALRLLDAAGILVNRVRSGGLFTPPGTLVD